MDDQKIKRSARLTRVVLKGMEEYIGQPELDHLLSTSEGIPFHTSAEMIEAEASFNIGQVGALQRALEDTYGPQGARGIALRSGRAAFCYLLKTLGERTGFDDLEFRLLPPRRRMRAGLERLAETLGGEAGGTIQIQDEDSAWLVRIERCPECWDRQSGAASCFFSIGLLQEFLSWLSGGKVFMVEEIACRAKGDPACVIRIDKKPLD